LQLLRQANFLLRTGELMRIGTLVLLALFCGTGVAAGNGLPEARSIVSELRELDRALTEICEAQSDHLDERELKAWRRTELLNSLNDSQRDELTRSSQLREECRLLIEKAVQSWGSKKQPRTTELAVPTASPSPPASPDLGRASVSGLGSTLSTKLVPSGPSSKQVRTVMKISVSRSGGFAGLTEDLGTVDTAALPGSTGRELEALVNQAGVFSGNVKQLDTAVGADMYRYAVTVEDEGRQATVTFTDDGSPGTVALRSLVERVIHLRK
jgi:hypothetical protein